MTSISKVEAMEYFRKMLLMHNRFNKKTLTKLASSAIKTFNESHPQIALTNDQRAGLAKRMGGLIYCDLENITNVNSKKYNSCTAPMEKFCTKHGCIHKLPSM